MQHVNLRLVSTLASWPMRDELTDHHDLSCIWTQKSHIDSVALWLRSLNGAEIQLSYIYERLSSELKVTDLPRGDLPQVICNHLQTALGDRERRRANVPTRPSCQPIRKGRRRMRTQDRTSVAARWRWRWGELVQATVRVVPVYVQTLAGPEVNAGILQ